jgi:hypothetical protein
MLLQASAGAIYEPKKPIFPGSTNYTAQLSAATPGALVSLQALQSKFASTLPFIAKITLKPGAVISFHIHPLATEIGLVTKGECGRQQAHQVLQHH